MPRASKPVDAAELRELENRALDLGADIRNMAARIRKTLEVAPGVQRATAAKTFVGLSAAAGDLSHVLLIILSFDEDRERIKADISRREDK